MMMLADMAGITRENNITHARGKALMILSSIHEKNLFFISQSIPHVFVNFNRDNLN